MGIRFRPLTSAATAIAAVSAVTVGVWPAPAAHDGPARPELGELIAGEAQYVDGMHVWTDYAYDDRGPNDDGVAGGDAAYPPESPGNEADLIQLQLGTDATGALTVAAVLETLREDTDAVLGVGLDVDPAASPQTGAVSVEGGRWRNRESLGLEHLVVLDSAGGAVVRTWDGGTWVDGPAVLASTVDREANVLTATVALWPGASTWEAVGVAGRRDAAGGSWRNGAQPIYDLAYLRAEDPTKEVAVALREQVPQLGFVPYQDKDQADVLAGRIPPHRATAQVAFGTNRNQPPNIVQGFNAFLYHSTVDVPEGVQSSPLRYDGPYMPYAVWIPPAVNLAGRPPLLMFLHGANQYQNVNLIHFNNPQSLVLPSPYDVPAVVIFPNGRTTGWGTPLADRDALDAMDDALGRSRLNLDPERVVVSGVSSGGAGTFQMAARYPDRFTGAYSLVGGGTTNLENLTNVPFRASNGALDPLVNVQTWRSSADALNAAGTVDYRIVLVHNRSHDGPLAEGNCYYLDLLSRRRVVDPTRVRYSTLPYNEERARLGVLPDGAYWVSAMDARAPTAPARVDLESLAKAPRVVADGSIREVGENLVSTADFCGPHPTMRNGTNWSIEGRSFRDGTLQSAANGLRGTLINLDALTVEVGRAGLRVDEPITLDLTSDGDTTLTLVGPGGWERTVHVGAGRATYTV